MLPELGLANGAVPRSDSRRRLGVPERLPVVPPWALILVALLLTALAARFMADGRIKYGLAIIFALCYGPLVFFNFPLAFVVWVGVQFFAELSQLSYGPNIMSVIIGLAWIGAFLGRRTPLGLVRGSKRWLLVVGALLAWVFFSIIWSPNTTDAVNEASLYAEGAFALLITLTTITTPKQVRYVMIAFVVGAVVSVFIGLATGGLKPSTVGTTQTAINGRLTGGGGDPNQQAAGYVATMFLILGMFSVYRTRLSRAWLTIAFLIIAVGFFATESRGGLIALALAAAAALVIAPRQRGRILLFAGGMGIASLILIGLSPGAIHRIVDVGGGTSGRSDLWKVGWEVFKAHPFNGVGIGNFVAVEPHYALQSGLLNRVQYINITPQIVHNTYLQLLAETGVIGLLLFVGVIAGFLRIAWQACRRFERIGHREYSDLTIAVVLATVGMLCALFFITNVTDPRLWVLLGLAPVMLGIARRMDPAGAVSSPPARGRRRSRSAGRARAARVRAVAP